MVTYKAELLYNHTIPKKGSQVIESLKAKRYTLQSSDPMHPSKKRVNYHQNFSQMFMLTENHFFLSLGGTVFTIVLPI